MIQADARDKINPKYFYEDETLIRLDRVTYIFPKFKQLRDKTGYEETGYCVVGFVDGGSLNIDKKVAKNLINELTKA